MAVGHAHADLFHFVLTGIDISVAFRLRKMYGHGPFHFLQIMIGSLNLIDRNPSFLRDNPVGTTLHHNPILIGIVNIAQRHLRLIGGPHPPLNHAVNPSSLLHGILRRSRLSIVDIAGAENKFHQTPHRNPHFHISTSAYTRKKTP